MNPCDIEALNKALAKFGEAIKSTAETLNSICIKFRETIGSVENILHKVSVEISDAMVSWYLQYHSKLPGSNRTTRLRKKRITVVSDWVEKQLNVRC